MVHRSGVWVANGGKDVGSWTAPLLVPNNSAFANLYCESPLLFACTEGCSAAAASPTRAFVVPHKYGSSFSPFMNDLTNRARSSGWDVLELRDLTHGRRSYIPDVLAFYILDALGYDALHSWRKSLNGSSSTTHLSGSSVFILIVEDIMTPSERYVLRNAARWFDALLARYPASTMSEVVGHYHVKPQRELFAFPHAACESFFRPLNFSAKTESVLLSGTMLVAGGHVYPLRVAATALLPSGLVSKRKVTTKRHNFSDPQQQAKDYAQAIARYHIAIAGCRQWHQWLWTVAKHFEIIAAGTAMLTDVAAAPYLKPLGLLPGRHYLESTPDNLSSTLRYWLAPEQQAELQAITARGHRVVRRHHSGAARARYLNDVSSALWAEKYPETSGCPQCAGTLRRAITTQPEVPCVDPNPE